MDLSLGFLRIEVVILLLSSLYTFYYFLGNIISTYINFSSILGKRSRSSKVETPKVMKIKTDENEHVENYNKDDLSYEKKLIINDLLKKARVNISIGDYELAKNFLVEGLSIDKFNQDLNFELAKIYVNEKEFTKAEYIYKDLLLVHEDDILVMKKLGDLLSLQEKYELATEIYKRAYKINKDDLEVINMLANLSYAIKDYIGAEIYLKEFLKEKPKELENLILLGNTYEKLEDYKEALEIFKKALIMKPYENEDLKEKIHKLEIYLLNNEEKIEENFSDNSFQNKEIIEKQEKNQEEEELEKKYGSEIEELEKNIKS